MLGFHGGMSLHGSNPRKTEKQHIKEKAITPLLPALYFMTYRELWVEVLSFLTYQGVPKLQPVMAQFIIVPQASTPYSIVCVDRGFTAKLICAK